VIEIEIRGEAAGAGAQGVVIVVGNFIGINAAGDGVPFDPVGTRDGLALHEHELFAATL
jgi:hypothetical protein